MEKNQNLPLIQKSNKKFPQKQILPCASVPQGKTRRSKRTGRKNFRDPDSPDDLLFGIRDPAMSPDDLLFGIITRGRFMMGNFMISANLPLCGNFEISALFSGRHYCNFTLFYHIVKFETKFLKKEDQKDQHTIKKSELGLLLFDG